MILCDSVCDDHREGKEKMKLRTWEEKKESRGVRGGRSLIDDSDFVSWQMLLEQIHMLEGRIWYFMGWREAEGRFFLWGLQKLKYKMKNKLKTYNEITVLP